MARTNRYTSINFNHIYEKNLNTNPTNNPGRPTSSSSSSPFSATSKNTNILYKNHLQPHHGRMLVLTRPTPKSITIPQPQQTPPQPDQNAADHTRPQPESDSISLRPLGGTLGCSRSMPGMSQEREKEVAGPVVSLKPERFVPPHLRPGFVGKEERPGPDVGQRKQGYLGSPVPYGEDGRPKSGGYERIRRGGGESDLGMLSRPSSSGCHHVSP